MKKSILLIIASLAVVLIPACAGLQQQVATPRAEKEKTVDIAASSFKFVPNNIQAYLGDVIVFKIDNRAQAAHNFTIEDIRGNVLQSVDLPPQKTIDIKVAFPEPGIYNFYCDKPFHSLFGMKGQVTVVKE